jgi:hypothetical protein
MLHRGPSSLGKLGPWEPAKRYWRGNDPEWDIVARSVDGERLLLAEAKWWSGVLSETEIMRAYHETVRKGTPPVRGAEKMKPVYALFVPEIASGEVRTLDFCLVDAEAVLSSPR